MIEVICSGFFLTLLKRWYEANKFDICLATAAAIVAWIFFSESTKPVPAKNPLASSASAVPDENSAMLRVTHRPLPVGPFDAIRAELESRALAGDAAAAYKLGHVIARCQDYRPIPGDEFVTLLAEMTLKLKGVLRFDGKPIDDQATLDLLLYSKDEADRICEGTDVLRRSARAGDAYAWINHAATLGHPEAMAEYGDHAFIEYRGAAALLDNAIEVARRRERARTLIEEAFRAGEPKALLATARAYGPNGYLGEDKARALAHWQAYRQGNWSASIPESVIGMADNHYGEGMDEASLSRADLLSKEILASPQYRPASK